MPPAGKIISSTLIPNVRTREVDLLHGMGWASVGIGTLSSELMMNRQARTAEREKEGKKKTSWLVGDR